MVAAIATATPAPVMDRETSRPSNPGPPPEEPGRTLLRAARSAVEAVLRSPEVGTPPSVDHPYLASRHPVFVTIRDRLGRLRGCVGTLTARERTVVDEARRMAREAAFGDSRFAPVRREELPGLRFEVSVLDPLEDVDDMAQLDPNRFGIVVSSPDGRRGALLPGIEGVETTEEQLAIVRRKAGIGAKEPICIQRFTVARFSD